MMTHGMSQAPEYRVWAGMISRCENHNSTGFKNYGGRGIRVCPQWRESFAVFLSDIGPRPSAKHSIDRFPDNDGDYKPSNCRWATSAQQAANKRWKLKLFEQEERLILMCVKCGDTWVKQRRKPLPLRCANIECRSKLWKGTV